MKASAGGHVSIAQVVIANRAILDLKSKVCVCMCDVCAYVYMHCIADVLQRLLRSHSKQHLAVACYNSRMYMYKLVLECWGIHNNNIHDFIDPCGYCAKIKQYTES